MQGNKKYRSLKVIRLINNAQIEHCVICNINNDVTAYNKNSDTENMDWINLCVVLSVEVSSPTRTTKELVHMDDVGHENSEKPEMMPHFLPSLNPSLSPQSRKKAMSVSASAQFLHYQIIHIQVYEIKTNIIPARL